MKLREKVAIITGGASGQGRAACLLFAKEGAKVAAVDIDEVRGRETVKMITDGGGDATFVRTDVSRASEVKNACELVHRQYKRLDILYNNAGVIGGGLPLEQTTEEQWDKVITVNLKSVFLFSKYAIPYLKLSKGAIINVGSIGAVLGINGTADYGASKAGVVQLTKVLAVELAQYGVRVNCVSPGAIDTPMLDYIRSYEPAALDARIRAHPLARMGKAEEVAKAALFLACDDSSFVTGHNLAVDGGYSIKGN